MAKIIVDVGRRVAVGIGDGGHVAMPVVCVAGRDRSHAEGLGHLDGCLFLSAARGDELQSGTASLRRSDDGMTNPTPVTRCSPHGRRALVFVSVA